MARNPLDNGEVFRMSYSNRRLKELYLDLRYQNKVLSPEDRSPKLPISSGNALVDACLFEKIQQTPTTQIEEHLLRAWQMVERATEEEINILYTHRGALLNDHKILLAMRLFQEEREDQCHAFLKSLPFGWEVQFPTAFIKPADVFFTGWKGSLDFRLVKDIPYTRLRKFFADFIEHDLSEMSLLKYRAKLKTALALLRYPVISPRERAVSEWCFDRKLTSLPDFPLINTFLAVRQKAKVRDEAGFIQELKGNPDVNLPITSYMGLLGTLGVELNSTNQDFFREYAVKCATFVESLLRLNEWAWWLTDDQIVALGKRLVTGYEKGMLTIDKITNAFANIDNFLLQKKLTDLVFLPLLKRSVADLNPLLPSKFEMILPLSYFIFTNFLLYLVMNAVADGKLTLFHGKTVRHLDFTLDILSEIIKMDVVSFDDYLFKHYRAEYSTYVSEMESPYITDYIKGIPRERMLVIDLPFSRMYDLMYTLNQHDTIFNISKYCGLSGEISLQNNAVELAQLKIMGEDFFTATQSRPKDAVTDFVAMLEKVRVLNQVAHTLKLTEGK